MSPVPSRQKEPIGLGHAVLSAKHFIGDEPFAVLLGDDIMVSETPALRQLLEVYEEYQTEVIGVQPVDPADVSKYGIIQTSAQKNKVYQIDDLVEKPTVKDAPPDEKANPLVPPSSSAIVSSSAFLVGVPDRL